MGDKHSKLYLSYTSLLSKALREYYHELQIILIYYTTLHITFNFHFHYLMNLSYIGTSEWEFDWNPIEFAGKKTGFKNRPSAGICMSRGQGKF